MASTGVDPHSAARRLLETVALAFEQSGVRCALIGGQAVNLLLEPRLTFDVDFTVVAPAAALEQVRDFLVARGFELVRSQITDPARGLDFMRFRDPGTGLGIDISQASTEFEELAISRARKVDSSQPIPAATAEDLIVFKLIAGRTKDHRDTIELLQLPNLDWEYIEHWARSWQVEDRLQKLRDLIASEER